MNNMGFYERQFPMQQGRSAGPYPRILFHPGGLGFYRPNQAFYRGVVPGNSATLGDSIDPTSVDFTDPSTLLMLAGAGFLAWYLFKGGRSVSRSVSSYRRRRRSKKNLRLASA